MSFGSFKKNQENNSLIIIVLIVMMTMFTACAEKDDDGILPQIPTKPENSFGLPISIDSYPESKYPRETIDYTTSKDGPYDESTITQVSGISLQHFIEKSKTDNLTNISDAKESRMLFTYRFVGSDNYTPKEADMFWDFVKEGYLILDIEGGRAYNIEWYKNKDLRNYCVKEMRGGRIDYFRAVVVDNGLKKHTFYLNTLEKHDVPSYSSSGEGDVLPAIKLTDLITTIVSDTPENYKYVLRAVDWETSSSGTQEYEWSEIQEGYFTLGVDRTTFPNFTSAEMGNAKRGLRNLMSITLVGK